MLMTPTHYGSLLTCSRTAGMLMSISSSQIPILAIPLLLHMALNIPLLLNSIAYSPFAFTVTRPPVSAGSTSNTLSFVAWSNERPPNVILACTSCAVQCRNSSSPFPVALIAADRSFA